MTSSSPKKSRIKDTFTSIFNFRFWMDYDRIKSFFLYMKNGVNKMFVLSNNTGSDTNGDFEKKAFELGLGPEQLKKRYVALYRISIILLIVATGLFGYFIYHLIYLNIMASILSLCLVGIALVLSFRYHFWYFQIKNQRLGCTFNEWFNQGFLGRK